MLVIVVFTNKEKVHKVTYNKKMAITIYILALAGAAIGGITARYIAKGLPSKKHIEDEILDENLI